MYLIIYSTLVILSLNNYGCIKGCQYKWFSLRGVGRIASLENPEAAVQWSIFWGLQLRQNLSKWAPSVGKLLLYAYNKFGSVSCWVRHHISSQTSQKFQSQRSHFTFSVQLRSYIKIHTSQDLWLYDTYLALYISAWLAIIRCTTL
jgi:hypothetical protein